MSLSINFNSAALTAGNNLSKTNNSLNTAIQRLSSGYRINSAADDPAGLVISNKMQAQIDGLNQAISNAGDAVNMTKTAEGALNEVNSLLNKVRTLAVQAANGTNDSASLQADQAQIKSAIDSINKISSETMFGGKKLLDGSSGLTSTVTGNAIVSADISKSTLSSSVIGAQVNVTVAALKATATGTVDVSAVAANKSITINGVTVNSGAGGSAALLNSINAVTNQTGVVAILAGNDLKLDQKSFGSANRIDITGADAAIWSTSTAAATGTDAVAKVTTDGLTNISDATWTKGSGTVIKDSLGDAIQLTDVAAAAATDKGAQFNVAAGTMSFQVGAYAGQTRSLNISSSAANQLGLANGTTTLSVAGVDVTTQQGAQDALTVLDKAISDVSTMRGNLGAVQTNTLESAVNSLTVASQNIAASQSSIKDVDMASEMTEFTKNQILESAGVSMLAQANQAPQALLKLLG
jgi:flagellin